MQSLDLQGASIAQLNSIISQAEKRLEHQIAFAAAADQRSAIVGGAATSLAAASLAIAVQKFPTIDTLTVSAFSASVLFWIAAFFALRAARCFEFHPSGYRPRDFISDIDKDVSEPYSLREICADLDFRLEFNTQKLEFRGDVTNKAMVVMIFTPVASALLGALFFLLKTLPTESILLFLKYPHYSQI